MRNGYRLIDSDTVNWRTTSRFFSRDWTFNVWLVIVNPKKAVEISAIFVCLCQGVSSCVQLPTALLQLCVSLQCDAIENKKITSQSQPARVRQWSIDGNFFFSKCINTSFYLSLFSSLLSYSWRTYTRIQNADWQGQKFFSLFLFLFFFLRRALIAQQDGSPVQSRSVDRLSAAAAPGRLCRLLPLWFCFSFFLQLAPSI